MSTVDITDLTLDDLREQCLVMSWLRELSRDIHFNRLLLQEAFAPLPSEGASQFQKRMVEALRKYVVEFDNITALIPGVYTDVRDGVEISESSRLQLLLASTAITEHLRVRNATLVEVVNGLNALHTAWANNVPDAEFVRWASARYPISDRFCRAFTALQEKAAFPPEEPLTDFEKSIRDAFEVARGELVNTGLRNNNFLNWRPSTGERGVDIVSETSIAVHRQLILEEGSLGFKPLQSPQTEEAPEVSAQEQFGTMDLQTSCPSDELADRLLNTNQFARSYIENRGANILYLALGMLHWKGPDDPDTVRKAPLILVPVKLERENALTPFRIRYTGEDIEPNGPLIKRLKDEFGISLPPFPPELDPQEYFFQVEETIRNIPGFTLNPDEITVGLFASSMRMYDDLDTDEWSRDRRPWKHPMMIQLFGGGFNEPAPHIPTGARVDEYLDCNEHMSFFGCDSSQERALAYVNSGHSAVLIGPPGSGKSWTIAEFLEQQAWKEKSVVFCSAKPAALEVVERRLRMMGLGDLILAIPSHDVSKKQILDELRRTVALGEPEVVDPKPAIDRYMKLRDELNKFCDSLGTPINNSGLTPYEVLGQLMELGPKTLTFEYGQMRQWTRDKFLSVKDALLELGATIATHGIPADNPFYGSKKTNISPTDAVDIKLLAGEAREAAIALDEAANVLLEKLNLKEKLSPQNLTEFLSAFHDIQEFTTRHGRDITQELKLDDVAWGETHKLDEVVAVGSRYVETHAKYGAALKVTAWDTSPEKLQEMQAAFNTVGTRFWSWSSLLRWKNGDFWKARKVFRSLYENPKKAPKKQADRLLLLSSLEQDQKDKSCLTSNNPMLTRVFGSSTKDIEKINWRNIDITKDFGTRFHSRFSKHPCYATLCELVRAPQRIQEIKDILDKTVQQQSRFERAQNAIFSKLELDISVISQILASEPLHDDIKLFEQWESDQKPLEKIVACNIAAKKLSEQGAEFVADTAMGWKGDTEVLATSLECSWLRGLSDDALRSNALLSNFDARAHERLIQQYLAADYEMLETNGKALVRRHWERIPRIDTGGEVGALNRELNRRARNKPIAEIWSEAPNVLRAIKPIIMLTPRAVAEYLPRNFKADVYVGDEESQKEISDALGAFMRTDYAFVVGDDKQMAASRVFKQHSENHLGSVLDQFQANGASRFMLTGSYRFRDPTLVQCSNILFYDGKLRVFPTPVIGRSNIGLKYNYEPLRYEGGGINRAEALKVAERAIEHARNTPQLSLGIAAFSQEQASVILKEVDKLRRNNPELEKFFTNHPHEPFFVKNLENVQGDERDVIFVSTAYGKGATNKLRLTFGTLNQPGGEKGLNVLFTRAKSACEVFTAIDPDEMDLSHITSEGVHALKAYLNYAKHGKIDKEKPQTEDKLSSFERVVKSALETKGYEVHVHIGSSECHVSLAVVNPDDPGRYIMGIQVDGPHYQKALSARERDRLTDEVLSGLGWNICHTWVLGWDKDPEGELQHILKAIDEAKLAQEIGLEKSSQKKNKGQFGRLEQRVINRGSEPGEIKPGRGEPYVFSKVVIDNSNSNGNGKVPLHEQQKRTLARYIREVVEVEAPVHVKEVMRRIRDAAGLKNLSASAERALDEAMDTVANSKTIERRDDFFYIRGKEIPYRDRSDFTPSTKKLELISPEELKEAIRFVVQHAQGIRKREVPQETVEVLGFKSVPQDTQAVIMPLVEELLSRDHLIKEEKGRLMPLTK